MHIKDALVTSTFLGFRKYHKNLGKAWAAINVLPVLITGLTYAFKDIITSVQVRGNICYKVSSSLLVIISAGSLNCLFINFFIL